MSRFVCMKISLKTAKHCLGTSQGVTVKAILKKSEAFKRQKLLVIVQWKILWWRVKGCQWEACHWIFDAEVTLSGRMQNVATLWLLFSLSLLRWFWFTLDHFYFWVEMLTNMLPKRLIIRHAWSLSTYQHLSRKYKVKELNMLTCISQVLSCWKSVISNSAGIV
jgi:hypothetical protein